MPKKMINCRICQDEFSTKRTLKVHFRRRHKKSIFICKICHVISYSIDEKILHRINHHKFIFKCDNCERTFKEKKGLNRHVRLNHKDLQLNNVISSTNTRPSKSSSTSALVKKSKKGTIIILLKGIYVRCAGCQGSIKTHWITGSLTFNWIFSDQYYKCICKGSI